MSWIGKTLNILLNCTYITFGIANKTLIWIKNEKLMLILKLFRGCYRPSITLTSKKKIENSFVAKATCKKYSQSILSFES